jgi:hypothetical protein
MHALDKNGASEVSMDLPPTVNHLAQRASALVTGICDRYFLM